MQTYLLKYLHMMFYHRHVVSKHSICYCKSVCPSIIFMHVVEMTKLVKLFHCL